MKIQNFFRLGYGFIRVVLPYWLSFLALVVLLPLMTTKDVGGIPTCLFLWFVLSVALTVAFLHHVPDDEQHVARLIFFPKCHRRKYLPAGWHFVHKTWWYIPKDVHGKKEKPDRGRFRQHLGEKKLRVVGSVTSRDDRAIEYSIVFIFWVLKGEYYSKLHSLVERSEIEGKIRSIALKTINDVAIKTNKEYLVLNTENIFMFSGYEEATFGEVVEKFGNYVSNAEFEKFC